MNPVQFPFREVQRFRQWWIWPIYIVIAALPVFLTYELVFADDAPQPVMYVPIIFACLFSVLLILLLASIRLETEISREAISYRFFPIHRKTRVVPWSDLVSAEVRQYSPLREYGGWGLRISLKDGGLALNISGNQGIQLVFKNGKRVLIGTRSPEQMKAILSRIAGDRAD